jgi:hypothetical protein
MGEARRRRTNDANYGVIPKGAISRAAITAESTGEKFLYLTKSEWAGAWVNGGEIPINLASYYRSDSRSGIYTPDENLIHQSSVDLRSLQPYIRIDNVKNLTLIGNYFDGQRAPDVRGASSYKEDGLILSFCTTFDAKIAKRLGKKACVKILNVDELKKCIDTQLGIIGDMGECRYTRDHQRDHFMKSVEDEWQREYRIFWKSDKPVTVTLPPGMAAVAAFFD